MILQPQVDFPISRQIANHLDTATYYVQAKVYDADGKLIATINLTDKGSQRFIKRWRVPVDGSGQGAYISIITSVFTDSGYSSKSSNYGDEEVTYLIFDRVNQVGRGGGGGKTVSASEIKRIVNECINDNKVEPVEVEPVEPVVIPNYSDEFKVINIRLGNLGELVKVIPTEATDIFPILEGIQNLANAIADKEVTPETDLSPVLTELGSIENAIADRFADQTESMDESQSNILEKIVTSMQEAVDSTEFVQEMSVKPVRKEAKAAQAPAAPAAAPEAPQQPFNMRNLVK